MILKISVGLVVAGLIGLLVWVFVQSENDCTASGGHEVTTGYTPVIVGRTIIMNPVIECEH